MPDLKQTQIVRCGEQIKRGRFLTDIRIIGAFGRLLEALREQKQKENGGANQRGSCYAMNPPLGEPLTRPEYPAPSVPADEPLDFEGVNVKLEVTVTAKRIGVVYSAEEAREAAVAAIREAFSGAIPGTGSVGIYIDEIDATEVE